MWGFHRRSDHRHVRLDGGGHPFSQQEMKKRCKRCIEHKRIMYRAPPSCSAGAAPKVVLADESTAQKNSLAAPTLCLHAARLQAFDKWHTRRPCETMHKGAAKACFGAGAAPRRPAGERHLFIKLAWPDVAGKTASDGIKQWIAFLPGHNKTAHASASAASVSFPWSIHPANSSVQAKSCVVVDSCPQSVRSVKTGLPCIPV